jgi:hypothetical protein
MAAEEVTQMLVNNQEQVDYRLVKRLDSTQMFQLILPRLELRFSFLGLAVEAEVRARLLVVELGVAELGVCLLSVAEHIMLQEPLT